VHDANHRVVVVHDENRLGQIDSHHASARTAGSPPTKVAINTSGP
jgi:hypothetical protein